MKGNYHQLAQNTSFHQRGSNSKVHKTLVSPYFTLLSPSAPSRPGPLGLFYSVFHWKRENPRRWCPSIRSQNGCISQGNQSLGLVFLSPQQGGHSPQSQESLQPAPLAFSLPSLALNPLAPEAGTFPRVFLGTVEGSKEFLYIKKTNPPKTAIELL